MAQLDVTELDFDSIKANLRNFLEGQEEFSDFNFEGSGLNILLEILAYNTHYNGMLAHMLANENFIDTAIKRESVVSIAKALGYTPRSRRGALAKVNLTVVPPSTYTSTTLQINRNTPFSTQVDGATYKLYPLDTTTDSATTAGEAGTYFLYGTSVLPTAGTKGYYYPVYLTETAAQAANTKGTGSTTYTFTEYPGVSFYIPNDNINEGVETLGTSTNQAEGVTIDSGLPYGMYTGQSASSATQTQFNFNSLAIKEGLRVENKFVVSQAALQGPFVVPNLAIDTSTLRVRVQESASDLTVTTYTKAEKILDIKAASKVYFVEEGADGLYQIRFGDDVLGKQLKAGNIILVDYINSNATAGNDAKTFTMGTTLAGTGETITLKTAIQAFGGAFKESIDEIRHNAPKHNATRDRAVTSSDYESLILASNSNIQSCSVWGGEKNDPPIYGKVFISLNPVVGSIITESDKDNIKTSIIDPKTPVAIIPEFVDPEFTHIGLDINLSYDPKLTSLSKGEIESQVNSAVVTYFNTDLNKLNKSFYNTRLHDAIKAKSESIIAIGITNKLQKRMKPDLDVVKNYTVMFNQKLQPREVTSSYFNIKIGTVLHKVTLIDVPGSTVVPPTYSGTGVINAIALDGTKVSEVGTIDYDSGKITIPSIIVNSLYGTETHLRINAVTQRDVRDITTQALVRTSDTSTAAVVAKPSRNTVLTLDDSVANSTINTKVGLNISATPEVEEI